MNCVECLNELATGSLRDLQPTSSVMDHCARCSDCGPLLTALRDREYNAATTLNTLQPMSDPIRIAENAAMVAHRRRVGKVVTFITGGVLVATIWTSLFLTSFGRGLIGFDRGRGLASLRTETIQLQCLSPEQAGEIISPYVRSHGSAYYVSSSGFPLITVRGTPDEVAKARELIGSFETDGRAACRNDLRIDLGKLRELENLRELEKLGPALAPLRDLVPPASPDPVKKK